MKLNIIDTYRTLICAMAMLVSTVGCTAHTPPPPMADNCRIPSGNLVDEAFSTARSTLSRQECSYSFDEVYTSLLNISAGKPDIKNKELFSDLLEWSRDQGIISEVQAQEYYTTHFSSNFISLPDSYQTCSLCSSVDTIIADCDGELDKKEQGLLKVSNDREAFTKASSDLQQIALILEATCAACDAE